MCGINNDVRHSSVPINMGIINKDDCENIFNLIETISVQSEDSGVNVSREAFGLKISLVSDGSFTKSEIRAMAENWVQAEDDPDIIDA